MAPGDYSSVGAGKLKLKGVKDSKVEKKKKKKKAPTVATGDDDEGVDTSVAADEGGDAEFRDRSVVLKRLEEEDREIAKQARRDGKAQRNQDDDNDGEDDGQVMKTEAERRYEEQRRKRVGSTFSRFPGALDLPTATPGDSNPSRFSNFESCEADLLNSLRRD
jgi:protein FAM32A